MPSLLDLSDETLLNICSNLTTSDLHPLSLACSRLQQLVKDQYLWIRSDNRARENSAEKLQFCKENIHEKTAELMIAADSRLTIVADADFLKRVRSFHNLTVLALENQLLDATNVRITDFPKNLQELSLSYTYVANSSNFLQFCCRHFANLNVLCLNGCKWLATQMLISLCKLPDLQVLSVMDCTRLCCELSYMGLIGLYGFKRLKVLDVRGTLLGDEFLKVSHKLPQLGELYMQTHHSLYFERKNCWLAKNKSKYKELYEVDLRSKEAVKHLMGDDCYYEKKLTQCVTSESLLHFRRLIKNAEEYKAPSSILYKRPYDCCQCFQRAESKKTKPLPSRKELNGFVYLAISCTDPQKPRTAEDLAVLENTISVPATTTILEIGPLSEGPRIAISNDVNYLPWLRKRKREHREHSSSSDDSDEGDETDGEPQQKKKLNPAAAFVPLPPHANREPSNLSALSLRGFRNVDDDFLHSVNNLNLDLLDVTDTCVTKEAVRQFLAEKNQNCRVLHRDYCTCEPLLY